MYLTAVLSLAGLLTMGGVSDDVPITLSGSMASMERQHRVARASGFRFLRTPAEVRHALSAGELIRLRGGRNFAVKDPREGAARPELGHFIEHFSARFRSTCGERLVVTSLTRPLTRQPSNAHPLSVHPAGMAMDLRLPRRARCRRWVQRELLDLERRGILDATLERSPAHLHVALFPDRYVAYVARGRSVEPRVVAGPVVAAAVVLPATPPLRTP